MVPPTGPLNLDVEAISGICGSISIACWVVVFSPQIIENFRRASADGLSLQFVIVWLAGDVFNILGAVLQGVLPTMIILAVYYTIADIVLLGQCFYYRGFTWRDEVVPPPKPRKSSRRTRRRARVDEAAAVATERTTLLAKNDNDDNDDAGQHDDQGTERRGSNWSTLSPAVPFVPTLGSSHPSYHHHQHHHHEATAAEPPAGPVATTAADDDEAVLRRRRHQQRRRRSTPATTSSAWQAAAFNAFSMLMVIAAGVAGWYLSGGRQNSGDNDGNDNDNDSGSDPLALNVWGQVFGYLCAVLYLGSRLPQLLLNWRRQSTDGVSMLFFLFACLGNLTYVLAILAYDDGCASASSASSATAGCAPGEGRARYGRYLLVNLSWLAGSLGTLLLDMGIFLQFFLYRQVEEDEDTENEGSYSYSSSGEEEEDGAEDALLRSASDNDDDDDDDNAARDQRPLLQRNISSFHG